MRRALSSAVAAAVLLGAAACSDEAPTRDPGARTGPSDTGPSESGKERRTPGDAATPTDLPSAPPITDRFLAAAGPRELAARLTTAEDLVRAPDAPDDALRAAAFETQLLYRQLARTPRWERAVRAAAPPRHRAALDDHLTARHSLSSLLSTLSAELPAWRIVEPAPTADLLRFYREGERTYGIPWEVLAAINLVETGFGRIHGLSSAGAQGPMQFIPSTWAAYGEGDINDPHDAILSAARYLAANGGDGDRAELENALYRYNNHQGYVAGILAYASVLERDPRALRGLVRWQIIYLSTIGDVWLPIGYRETAPVPVRRYVARYPERHLGTETH